MKKAIVIILILIMNTANADFDVVGDLYLLSDEGKIYFYNGVYYVSFGASSSLGANYDFLWPVNDGDNNQYLKTDGSGVLVWDTPAGSGDMLKATYDVDEDGLIDQASGGTEFDTSGVTNGQILIGNSTGNVFALATLTGTGSQVTITNAAGSITISLPQNIATTSSPTFAGLNLDLLTLLEQSANPTEPSDGEAIIWLSDGSGYGDAGDVMVASATGGNARYGTLFDFSGGALWEVDTMVFENGDTMLLESGDTMIYE